MKDNSVTYKELPDGSSFTYPCVRLSQKNAVGTEDVRLLQCPLAPANANATAFNSCHLRRGGIDVTYQPSHTVNFTQPFHEYDIVTLHRSGVFPEPLTKYHSEIQIIHENSSTTNTP